MGMGPILTSVPVQRISRAVLAYIGLAVLQLVVVLIISGSGVGVSVPGVVLAIILFGSLYQGKPLAWWILLAFNTVGLIGLVVGLIAHLSSGDHVLWGNVIVLLCTTAAMEAALLSPAMRRHVASRGLRIAPRAEPRPAVMPAAEPANRPDRAAASLD
jgi:hypothetical protein